MSADCPTCGFVEPQMAGECPTCWNERRPATALMVASAAASAPRYPGATWAPWRHVGGSGLPSYYRGANRPAAVVLHVMAGHLSTALGWARDGYPYVSWHFSVGRDGRVYQHLDFADGGYHAGITDAQAWQHPPRWQLWRGLGINVNHYTIGIEHEGFAGQPFTAAQERASRDLCRWLAAELGIPLDRDHFPPHADIDTVNRPHDFNTPALREAHYRFLFEEDDDMGMTPEERAEFDELKRAVHFGLAGAIQANTQKADAVQRQLEAHQRSPHGGDGGDLPDHTHEPGQVKR